MRSTILCTLCLCLSIYSIAQKQGNIWVFGYKGGANFNTTPPSIMPSGAGIHANQEGMATISDSAGRFLFWSDGVDIYSSRGIMPNGNALAGHRSSTQSSIIVPKPGSDSLFYLFTSDAGEAYNNKTPHGYNYSVINMCLGWKHKDTILGGVIAGQKNIHLVDSGTEKLCAASDGANGYWILGHQGFSDAFVAWHLTSTGLSAPVITRIGPMISIYGFHGQMKFNAAGTKVAVVSDRTVGYSSTLDLFDFDPLTGRLSNHCQNFISDLASAQPYGVEFSPDGSKVYTSYNYGSGGAYLIQNTLSSDCGEIGESRDTVFKRIRFMSYLNSIQAAPDGKLYVGYNDAYVRKSELHRINNPNGARSYDTSVFIFLYQVGILPNPPSLVAGLKYHNKLCKCSQPVAVASMPSATTEIQVFPNPADEVVTIASTNGPAANLSLVVVDATGRMIYRSTTLPARIDLSKQATGLYFYKIYDEVGFEKAGKFVVAH